MPFEGNDGTPVSSPSSLLFWAVACMGFLCQTLLPSCTLNLTSPENWAKSISVQSLQNCELKETFVFYKSIILRICYSGEKLIHTTKMLESTSLIRHCPAAAQWPGCSSCGWAPGPAAQNRPLVPSPASFRLSSAINTS